MTLKEYYIEKDSLGEKEPKDLTMHQSFDWYRVEIEKLQKQLNKADLDIVLARQRKWQDKMQTAVG